jgi:hypothetical protein
MFDISKEFYKHISEAYCVYKQYGGYQKITNQLILTYLFYILSKISIFTFCIDKFIERYEEKKYGTI